VLEWLRRNVVSKDRTRKQVERGTPKKTDVREEMSAEAGKLKGNKDPRLKEATITEKRGHIWENLREELQTGEREANSRIFYCVTKNQGPDIVEGSTTEIDRNLSRVPLGTEALKEGAVVAVEE
jgi:hypothetical protein